MNFRSDNTAPIAPQILAALIAANEGQAAPYGQDAWSQRLNGAFSELFEHEAYVFPVSTGTAANALALASVARAGQYIVCHREAHIERDEAGAPEFFTGGARLALVDGPGAKITPDVLESALARYDDSVHSVAAAAVSITQPSERGVPYRADEVRALSAICKRAGLALHMDGARFANAVAALGCAPADLTWRVGVDILSFGATKNGALGADAIVVFDSERMHALHQMCKRGGQLASKGRYLAAQLLAYVESGLWLELARGANALTQTLAEAAGGLLTQPAETNQVFVKLNQAAHARLRAAGVDFYSWGENGDEARFVVSWSQAKSDVEALGDLLRSLQPS